MPLLLYQGATDAQDGPATNEPWIYSLAWCARSAARGWRACRADLGHGRRMAHSLTHSVARMLTRVGTQPQGRDLRRDGPAVSQSPARSERPAVRAQARGRGLRAGRAAAVARRRVAGGGRAGRRRRTYRAPRRRRARRRRRPAALCRGEGCGRRPRRLRPRPWPGAGGARRCAARGRGGGLLARACHAEPCGAPARGDGVCTHIW